MSIQRRILKPDQSYSFHSYFKMRFSIVDILQELDATYVKATMDLPRHEVLPLLTELTARIDRGRRRVLLNSEMARREILISPILLDVADWMNATIEIEYGIEVNQYLKGALDYYLRSSLSQPTSQLLVVEAKQSDLTHGFVQLAVEMIALDQWTDLPTPILYGAVTTGESWVFGAFDRSSRTVTEDLKIYRIPEDLAPIVSILAGILSVDVAPIGQPHIQTSLPSKSASGSNE
jgi:hypothetical protein